MKTIATLTLFLVTTSTLATTTIDKELEQTIRKAGESCAKVDEVFYNGEVKDRTVLSVDCGAGFKYLVIMRRNKPSQVFPCKVIETITGRNKCFKKL
jgi:hypothetical protein